MAGPYRNGIAAESPLINRCVGHCPGEAGPNGRPKRCPCEEDFLTKLTRIAGVTMALLAGTVLSPANAQSNDRLLRGVTGVDPFILPLDKDSETCGLDAAHVRRVLNEATTDAPFRLDGRDYVLFVRLSSLPKRGDCFSSIDIGVYWEGDVPLPGSPRGVRAKIKLWEKGTILISPNSLHRREVSGILKYLVANLIAAWKEDNGTSG